MIVDGRFQRSGFNPDRVYTPQGEWTRYQCRQRCDDTSVWLSRPMLNKVLPHVQEDGDLDGDTVVPKCRRCGGPTFGNVRGGDWFIHEPYKQAQAALI